MVNKRIMMIMTAVMFAIVLTPNSFALDYITGFPTSFSKDEVYATSVNLSTITDFATTTLAGGVVTCGSAPCYNIYYFNFSAPEWSLKANSSLWSGTSFPAMTDSLFNDKTNCMIQEPIQLKVENVDWDGVGGSGPEATSWCWDGSDWIDEIDNSSQNFFWEYHMRWAINDSKKGSVNVLGYDGSALSSITIETDNNNYSNQPFGISYQDLHDSYNETIHEYGTIPFNTSYTQYGFINWTTNFLFTDLNYNYQNKTYPFNTSIYTYEYNVSMDRNQLSLEFYQDGSLVTTDGFISDGAKTFGFNDSSYVIWQQNLSNSKIDVRFNKVGGGSSNWSQYYEYLNTADTHVDEDLEVVSDPNWLTYIDVFDLQGAPIPDAVVRAEFTFSELNNWTYKKLLGQRLTDDGGNTFFVSNDESEVLFSVIKDGYEAKEILVTIGDYEFTENDPMKVFLKESGSGVLNNAWIYVKSDYDNDTSIIGMLVAKDRDKVELQTDYRIAQGNDRRDISNDGDEFERYLFSLTEGSDYILGNDISLLVYLDNLLWRNITISYDDVTKNEIMNESTSGISSKIKSTLWALAMVLLAFVSRFIVERESIGKHVFMMMGALSGIIVVEMAWLSIVCALYYVFGMIRGVISFD